jgi:hypothetical protein
MILSAVAIAILVGIAGYRLGQRAAEEQASRPVALNPDYVSTHPPDIDPDDLITVRSASDAESVRRRMIRIVFGDEQLPDELPRTEPSLLDERLAGFFAPITSSVETLVVEMDHDIVSRAVHFVPPEGSGAVVILHEGHDATVLSRHREIAELLDNGFAVVAFSMPLIEPNSSPEITLGTGEVIRLSRHDQLPLAPPETGHPVKYFLEPVVRVVNYLSANMAYRTIGMVGVSGGGWTTALVAAVDPRITTSIPVAGSFPLYLRSLNDRDWGDWEETAPAIFDRVGYLDLYVLGASGCGRRQVQVFYEHDPCCYAGRAAEAYEEPVTRAAQSLEGSFDILIDSEYGAHGYSRAALDRAIREMTARPDDPCR